MARDYLSRATKKRRPMDEDMGTTVTTGADPVVNGTNLQAAIDAAVAGDTIVLTAGAEYRGNFTLPVFSGSSYITIRSTVGLPIGVRVSTATSASMARLTTATGTAVITLNASAHHWALVGLEITTAATWPAVASTRCPFLITNGSFSYPNYPTDFLIDRCYIHAAEVDPIPYRSSEEAVVLDGARISLTNNWIGNFMGWQLPGSSNAVTAASNADPCRVTLTSSIGADPGHVILITFTGGTGAWAAINGIKVATWVDSTHLDLKDFNYADGTLSNTNSTSWGALAGTVVAWTEQTIAASRAFAATVGPGPYTIRNNFLEAYYSPMFTGGGGSYIPSQNSVTISSVGAIDTITLSSIGDLQVGDVIAISTTQDQTISTAASHTDVAYTSLTVQAHRFPAGTRLYPEGYITVSGFTGSWAACNGNWGGNGNSAGTGLCYVIDSTHIAIPVNCSGFGAVTGSGMKWVAMVKDNSGFKQWHVGHVTNIAGTVVTYDWWGHQPENAYGNGAGILAASGATVQFRGVAFDGGITVTHNTLSVRRSWIWLIRDRANTSDNVTGQPPKAIWEAKQGSHVSITGNIFQIEGGPLDPMSGTVCLGINQASQNGDTPWIKIDDWTISNNLFIHYVYQKFSLVEEYESGSVGSGLVFSNNLLMGSKSSLINLEGTDSVTITHNTARNFGTGGGTGGGYNACFVIFDVPNTNTIVKDNIGIWSGNGYISGGTYPWTPAARTNNFFIDNLSLGFTPPAGDVRVATDAAMGFVNVTSADADGDYHGYALTVASTGHLGASDGTDVGVNFTALDTAIL